MSTALNQKAPTISAQCYHHKKIKKINLDDFKEYYKILFFYPLDFTYVCPTEIQELINKSDDFAKYDCKIFCINTDSVHSHEVWANQPRKEGGLEDIKDVYMISDYNKTICESYGTLIRNGDDEGISTRATYILDKNNIVKHVSANVLQIGRNIDEILRTVECVTQLENLGNKALPCNWRSGKKMIETSNNGKKDYFEGDTINI